MSLCKEKLKHKISDCPVWALDIFPWKTNLEIGNWHATNVYTVNYLHGRSVAEKSEIF